MKIYLIHKVRGASSDTIKFASEYVSRLEKVGHKVHFPLRDVEQNDDSVAICKKHRDAMYNCDEVHVIWDESSIGSHFDLGMAYMLSFIQGEMLGRELPIVIVGIYKTELTKNKSYTDFLQKIGEWTRHEER